MTILHPNLRYVINCTVYVLIFTEQVINNWQTTTSQLLRLVRIGNIYYKVDILYYLWKQLITTTLSHDVAKFKAFHSGYR